jgi:hypothetical protein
LGRAGEILSELAIGIINTVGKFDGLMPIEFHQRVAQEPAQFVENQPGHRLRAKAQFFLDVVSATGGPRAFAWGYLWFHRPLLLRWGSDNGCPTKNYFSWPSTSLISAAVRP